MLDSLNASDSKGKNKLMILVTVYFLWDSLDYTNLFATKRLNIVGFIFIRMWVYRQYGARNITLSSETNTGT